MLTCKDFDAFMVDFLEKNLPWSTQVSMQWHLLICSKCRDYVRDYKRTIELGRSVFYDLDEEVPESVPHELIDAVIARLDKEKGRG